MYKTPVFDPSHMGFNQQVNENREERRESAILGPHLEIVVSKHPLQGNHKTKHAQTCHSSTHSGRRSTRSIGACA
jgi:hypothetical protein